MRAFTPRVHGQAAHQRIVPVFLSLLLLLSVTAFRLPVAVGAPSPKTAVWDSQADFTTNAGTTGQASTLTGVDTTRVAGSVVLRTPLVAIAAGGRHTVGLTPDGTCVSVGENDTTQGDVYQWTDIMSIAAGPAHTLGVRADGTVAFASTYNYHGMMQVEDWADIVAVGVGEWHSVGLASDGTCVAVGDNLDGQLDVSAWTGIVAIAAGGRHTLGLKADGTVVATGYNFAGQCDVSAWTDIVAIDAGAYHSVGVKADGTVVATGYNTDGQCDVGGWDDIVAVAAGDVHTVGMKADGTAVAVGFNHYGQCNVGTWEDLIAIDAGGVHSVGLMADGASVAVGDNSEGQCDLELWQGLVSIGANEEHTIAARADGSVVAVGENDYGNNNVASWSNVTTVTAGEDHSVGLRADGTCVAAGDNYNGQCNVGGWTDIVAIAAGDDHTVGLTSSTRTVVAAGDNYQGQCDVGGWTDIVAIGAGDSHTIGVKADGTCVSTGANWSNESSVTAWTDIVAVEGGDNHTVGLRSDGTCVATGANGFGQCNVAEWTDIVAIAAGADHTVGLKSDGTCVGVGPNYYGEVDLAEWQDIVAIAAGDGFTVGLTADGSAVATGDNGYGQCDVLGWADPLSTRQAGTIGGAGTAAGLQLAVGEGIQSWNSLSFTAPQLRSGEAIKFAVRISEDGSSWSEPLGMDGEPIDWADGSGNYFGQAYGDAEPRVAFTGVQAFGHIDIVVRLEAGPRTSPELQSVTLSYLANSAPVAVDDHFSVAQDEQLVVPAPGVLANDSDPDGDPLSAGHSVGTGNGSLLAFNTDGSFTYTPDPGWHGTDSFTYWVGDGLNTDWATVTITVTSAELAVTPVAGAGRVETAIEASKLAFPAGADAVVIATARNWPDALGGSALAGALEAPILLVEPNALPAAVAAEIERLGANHAYILGGTGAVSAGVEAALAAELGSADDVDRIAGATRYETAEAVAAAAIDVMGAEWDGTAFVATGVDFPDALGASPLAAAKGWPIYLVHPNAANHPVLVTTMDDAGVTDVLILGGTGVVPASLETRLNTAFGDADVDRLAGADRYATAVTVATHGVEHAGLSWDKVAIATGQDFPDALAGGVLQGQSGSVMLLTHTAYLDTVVADTLTDEADTIYEVRFLGGTGAVSPAVRTAVTQILEK